MGADNLSTIHKWKNFEQILKYYSILVYPRPGIDLSKWKDNLSVTITEAPLMEISATFIRKSIQQKKNVQYFISEKVLQFIESKSLYK